MAAAHWSSVQPTAKELLEDQLRLLEVAKLSVDLLEPARKQSRYTFSDRCNTYIQQSWHLPFC